MIFANPADKIRIAQYNARIGQPLRFAEIGFWWSHLPVQRLCRTAHSQWLAIGYGMVSLRSCACSLDLVPIIFR